MLRIKVVPGSSRNRIAGWLGDALKLRVTAMPEKGKANDAVIALLAEALAIPRRAIRISTGGSSPNKVIEIIGLSDSEMRCRLSSRDA